MILMTFFLATGLASARNGWSLDASDFELRLYPTGGKYEYQLGEPIELIIVLRNAKLPKVYTKRGFELRQTLIVIDPPFPDGTPGTEYILQEPSDEDQKEKVSIHAMQAPFPFKGVTGWKEAQAFELPLSETINDLREQHTDILRKPGWHTIRASFEVFLFDLAEEHPVLGLLGLDNTGDNYHKIETKKEDWIQIFISPGNGALVQTQVLDDESQPLAQVPVSVFDTSDIPAEFELKDIWLNSQPVLSGTTDFEGWALWSSGAACLSRDKYSVIAYYRGEYTDALIEADDGEWGIGCSGLISRLLIVGGEKQTVVDELITVSYSGVRYNRRTRLFSSYASLTNNSTDNFKGPVWLVIKDLQPDEVILTNADGQTDGKFYIEVLNSDTLWQAGETISNIELLFSNPTRIRMSFGEEVRAVLP